MAEAVVGGLGLKAAVMALALAASAGVQPSGAQPAGLPGAEMPAPLVRVEGLKSVSPHVQVIPDNSAPVVPNVGFVVGTTGVLVVDTGLGAKNGAAVAAVAAKIAPGRQVFLVATHAHPEHDLGAAGFPPAAKLIRSTDQAAEAAADLALAKVFAARAPVMAELLQGAEFRPADITFATTYDLDLGSVSARLLALGPNHTAGDTAVWVAADRVLFSGDVAMQAQPSIMAPGTSLAQWMQSLDALEALQPAVVVPSHGPLGDVGYVRGYRAYLAEVARRTRAAKAAGKDVDAAIAEVQAAMGARYPDALRLAGAVRLAWRE